LKSAPLLLLLGLTCIISVRLPGPLPENLIGDGRTIEQISESNRNQSVRCVDRFLDVLDDAARLLLLLKVKSILLFAVIGLKSLTSYHLLHSQTEEVEPQMYLEHQG
jgi:hypothetical protein